MAVTQGLDSNFKVDALLLVCVALLAGCGGGGSGGGNTNPGVPPPTNTVSGTVSFNGAALAGVTITAFSTNNNAIFATTTTDASGNYSFSGLGTACSAPSCIINYQFVATKAGYSFNPVLAANPTGNRASYLWYAPAHNWYASTGAAVTRAAFNGYFSNSNGGAGISWNVINFNSVPNNAVTGANFSAYNGTTPLVQLAATGQAVSYVSGDDASLAKGVPWPATRFTDNLNGTISDHLTGLIWMKNAGCFAPTVWASALSDANQLASGACGLSDGSVPGDWRLPNLVEMESLIDASASNPALPAGQPFANVSAGIYWTSTSYYGGQTGSPSAWAVRMADGRYINDSTLNVKTSSSNAVWAVRGSSSGAVKLAATGLYEFYANGDDGSIESGVPMPSSRMLDHGDGTVTDTLTGLVWLKQADCIQGTWAQALAQINTLGNGQCGLSDGSSAGGWRMPNRKEMQSLSDRMQNNLALYFNETFVSGTVGVSSQPAIFSNFIGFQYYWTSTTDAANTSSAWATFSCDFGVYDYPKSSVTYALAVR